MMTDERIWVLTHFEEDQIFGRLNEYSVHADPDTVLATACMPLWVDYCQRRSFFITETVEGVVYVALAPEHARFLIQSTDGVALDPAKTLRELGITDRVWVQLKAAEREASE